MTILPPAPVLLTAALTTALASAGPVTITPAGKTPEFTTVIKNVSEISGLSWCKDDLYYAVSDTQPGIFPLRLTIDPATGLLTAVRAEKTITVTTSLTDFEDIACDTAAGQLFISTERPPALTVFTLTGQSLKSPVLPPIYQQARFNKGMEALTREPSTGKIWTVNEDTLTPDGDASAATHGGLVRLQEFDAKGNPGRQFAWRSDSPDSKLGGGGTGVTGLCALPGGHLIVMERVVTSLHLEVRLYLATFGNDSTDTSKTPALASAKFTPVQKTLLFSKSTAFTNFEGIALGPTLKDGTRSLILAADNGRGDTHVFMALKIANP